MRAGTMINLITMKLKRLKFGKQVMGGAFVLATTAMSMLAPASVASAQTTGTTATSAAGSTSTDASTTTTPPTNDAGATSGGGSFFVAPERTKEGAMTADQALKSTEVPEPGMLALFGGGAFLTLAIARRRRRK